MDHSYVDLLEKARLPQPFFQRLAVISLFTRFQSSPNVPGKAPASFSDAVSQCLRSPSPAVVDQTVRELCHLAAAGDLFPASAALIELQSSLDGCHPRFVPLFAKGIGFLCRLAFRTNPSWGRRFERIDLHPFVRALASREEAQEELIAQVLLFVYRNKSSFGISDVIRFLRPFFMFSMICRTSAHSRLFSRNLVSAIASFSCSFGLEEAIGILKLLAESLTHLPLTNDGEFLNLVHSASHIVDAYTVILQQSVGADKEVKDDAQRSSVEVLNRILSICAYFHKRKPLGSVEAIVEILRRLLVVQKELGLRYAFDFVKINVFASAILVQVEFEHEQLSVLKLLTFLLEWKTEELGEASNASFSLMGEELLLVFPAINILSSPSRYVKAAVARLLSLAESFILKFMGVLKKAEQTSLTDFGVLLEVEYAPLRLLHYYFTQVYWANEKYCGSLYCSSWLQKHLLPIGREEATPLLLSENEFEGMNILLGSIAFGLVIHPALDTSAVNFLVAMGLQAPKLGMTMFQAAIFYINLLFKIENTSSRILLNLLELLTSLASHPAMVQIVVHTILPMLQKDTKPSLHAVAIRLLCTTWVISNRAFENLQAVLSPTMLSNFEFMQEICISVAASIFNVCKHNPDRGVDIILSVSSCIESKDSIVKALGLQSLASLCEADVVDFYTAWEVVAKHCDSYDGDPIVSAGLVTLLRWGAMDVDAYPDIARSVLTILWKVGTLRSSSSSSDSLWVKARVLAFKSMMHYEIAKFIEIISEFKKNNLHCLLNEYNENILKSMEDFQIQIINFEHIHRRRALKERRPMAYKVEKILDVFPRSLFSLGIGNLNINARQFPGAVLLSDVFTLKELQGLSNDVQKIHAAFEKALVEIAESLVLSRNLVIALLVLESWKGFFGQWTKALITSTDAKGSSIELESRLKSDRDILKICCKVAVGAIPQVSMNIALAIGALCLVVPSTSDTIVSSASEFLLEWLLDYKHEHHQWPSAISLGLLANCFHATDRTRKTNVISGLLKVACYSKSHLVAGACGLGLGFACQGLLSDAESDSIRLAEEFLLHDVIKTLTKLLSKLSNHASDLLEKFIESLLPDNYDSTEALPLFPQWELDNLEEEDSWGVAGVVLGLGICSAAMHRLGLNDAVQTIKDIFFSWVPSPEESSNQRSLFCNKKIETPLAVGACLAIPFIVAFCENAGLMLSDISIILFRYVSLISELQNSKQSGIHQQNLLMASCIGAGSFVSCILRDGVHSIRYTDIKHLLEVMRNGYTKSHPPLVQLGAMIGVANAFGAAATGDFTFRHRQSSFLPISLDPKGSDVVRGPIILSPTCENLSTSYIQELFLVAKESKDQQIRKYAAWAVSFLRYKWCSERNLEIDGSKSIAMVSTPQYQSFDEESLVWKMCSWLSDINCYHLVHSSTVVSVLRCVSKAPRLPVLDWAAIIRGFMKNEENFANMAQELQDATSLQEECLAFSLSRAKDVQSLTLFLDDLVELSRFKLQELNLQCLLLRRVPDLMKAFSTKRIERLFKDFTHFFSSSTSPYFLYGSKQNVLLRISFWKGLYPCLNESCLEASCLSEIENCMECLFRLLPAIDHNAKSEALQLTCSEWSEAVKCLAKARHGWLMDVLQISSCSTLEEIAVRIMAKVRLVKLGGGLSFSELEKLKFYILNFQLEGLWWSLLAELVAAMSNTEVSIKRQWLLDALDVSCITENPSTPISFIGLLSGSCCKYMPLLIIEPEIVLRDLPMNLPSLLSSSSWSPIAEPCADKLLLSTERICSWAVKKSVGSIIDGFPFSKRINENDVHAVVFLARLMHQTCLTLKDCLPLEKRLRLANLEVP